MENKPKTKPNVERAFKKFADKVDKMVGSPFWFVTSLIFVVVWFLSGFIVGFTDQWQLVINTSTTILTFLMLSLLHTTQQKWENRMERLQEKEAKVMREIEKDTKIVTEEVVTKKDQSNDSQSDNSNNDQNDNTL